MDKHARDRFLQRVLARKIDDHIGELRISLREWRSPRTVGSRRGTPSGPPYLPSLTNTGTATFRRWLPVGRDSLQRPSSAGLACRCPVVVTGATRPYARRRR